MESRRDMDSIINELPSEISEEDPILKLMMKEGSLDECEKLRFIAIHNTLHTEPSEFIQVSEIVWYLAKVDVYKSFIGILQE